MEKPKTAAERQKLCRQRRREKLLQERKAHQRTCPACRLPLPLTARADSVTCSPRCRQFACRDAEHKWSEPFVQRWIGAREHFRALAGLRPVDPELEKLWEKWCTSQRVTFAGFDSGPPKMPPRMEARAKDDESFGEWAKREWRRRWLSARRNAQRRLVFLQSAEMAPAEVEKELKALQAEFQRLEERSREDTNAQNPDPKTWDWEAMQAEWDATRRSREAIVRQYKTLLKQKTFLEGRAVRLR